MRDMAKIVTIQSLNPIEGKDRIELATFNENIYQVIVQKGFKVGDKCIFVEADSLLPNEPRYEFLKSRCWKESLQRYRIKPTKMGNVISMAIVFDLSYLPKRKKEYKVGEDVTEVMNILKYEPVEDASPKKQTGLSGFMWNHTLTRPLIRFITSLQPKESKAFPTWLISKSDEENIQNNPSLLNKYKETTCYSTIKMEGQSVTFLFKPKMSWFGKRKTLGNFVVCSRNNAYEIPKAKPALFELAKNLDIKNALEKYYKKHGIILAVQGENCGPKIQKNIYGLKTNHFFIYTIKDLTNNRLVGFPENVTIAKELGADTTNPFMHFVPIQTSDHPLGCFDLDKIKEREAFAKNYFMVENFLEQKDFIIKNPESCKFKPHLHEGVVIRGCNNEFSFKIKDAEYAFNFSKND